MTALTCNSLAFFDSFAGLIPCRVSSIRGQSGDASTAQRVTFTLTASRGAYKRGETLQSFALHVVPRVCVVRHKYHTIILPYVVEVETRA